MWNDERLDSKSIASKILYKALPNTNNSACVSTSRAESKDSKALDSAIFAEQKSNKMCSTQVHTDTRPCRVWQSATKTAALYSFRGWGERGEGKPLFFLRKQVMMRI